MQVRVSSKYAITGQFSIAYERFKTPQFIKNMYNHHFLICNDIKQFKNVSKNSNRFLTTFVYLLIRNL